jgi:hypothetical protein
LTSVVLTGIIDVDWWREIHGVARHQVNAYAEKKHNKKLAALKAHTDPARNPYAHERHAAAAALAKLQAAGPPKPKRMPSAPGLEQYDREQTRRMAESKRMMEEAFKAARRGSSTVNTTSRPAAAAAQRVNTTTARPEPPPVNTTRPRSADRHREPNRDRHSPGYMRDYMRRRREKTRPKP